MKMKIIGLCIAGALVSAGCAIRDPGWTETSIGLGRYSVVPPESITQITGTNSNPTIAIWGCGKIQVHVNAFHGQREGDIWIDWIQGTVRDEITTNSVVEQPNACD